MEYLILYQENKQLFKIEIKLIKSEQTKYPKVIKKQRNRFINKQQQVQIIQKIIIQSFNQYTLTMHKHENQFKYYSNHNNSFNGSLKYGASFSPEPQNNHQLETPNNQNYQFITQKQSSRLGHNQFKISDKSSLSFRGNEFSPFENKMTHQRRYSLLNYDQNTPIFMNLMNENKSGNNKFLINSSSNNSKKNSPKKMENKRQKKIPQFNENNNKHFTKNINNLRSEVDREISMNRQIAKSMTGYLKERKIEKQDYKQQNIRQLKEKNQQLSEQLQELKNVILKLERELTEKQKQFLFQIQDHKRKLQEQKRKLNYTIQELKEQIQLLTEENQILYKSRNLLAKNSVDINQTLPLKEMNKFQKNQFKTLDILQQLKCMLNQQYILKIRKDDRKIKSTETDLIPTVHQIIKRNIKLQSFVKTLFDMKSIVTKSSEDQKDKDIKKLWRWLKIIVEESGKVNRYRQLQTELKQRLKLPDDTKTEQVLKKMKKLIPKSNR